jgi:hypothetical protein
LKEKPFIPWEFILNLRLLFCGDNSIGISR